MCNRKVNPAPWLPSLFSQGNSLSLYLFLEDRGEVNDKMKHLALLHVSGPCQAWSQWGRRVKAVSLLGSFVQAGQYHAPVSSRDGT